MITPCGHTESQAHRRQRFVLSATHALRNGKERGQRLQQRAAIDQRVAGMVVVLVPTPCAVSLPSTPAGQRMLRLPEFHLPPGTLLTAFPVQSFTSVVIDKKSKFSSV
jgi:hypothetical protein